MKKLVLALGVAAGLASATVLNADQYTTSGGVQETWYVSVPSTAAANSHVYNTTYWMYYWSGQYWPFYNGFASARLTLVGGAQVYYVEVTPGPSYQAGHANAWASATLAPGDYELRQIGTTGGFAQTSITW